MPNDCHSILAGNTFEQWPPEIYVFLHLVITNRSIFSKKRHIFFFFTCLHVQTSTLRTYKLTLTSTGSSVILNIRLCLGENMGENILFCHFYRSLNRWSLVVWWTYGTCWARKCLSLFLSQFQVDFSRQNPWILNQRELVISSLDFSVPFLRKIRNNFRDYKYIFKLTLPERKHPKISISAKMPCPWPHFMSSCFQLILS